MGIVYQQGSKTTIIAYLGVLIGYINVLWLFPAVLSAEQIGLIRLLPGIAFMLLPFTQLGLSQSILKFYPKYETQQNGSSELFSFMLIANLVGFGFTLIAFKIFQSEIESFFITKSALANDYLHVALALILILSYHVIFESFSRSVLKIVFPGMVKEIVLRLLYTTVVLLFFFDVISFSQVVNGLIMIYVLALMLLASYVFKRITLRFTLKFHFFGKSEFREIAQYSVFTLLGASGNYVMLNIDQLMISNLIGLEANGIYTTAFYIAIVIEMPRRALANITTPLISKHFSNHQVDEVNQLYKQVSINQMLVGSLLLIGILVNLNNVFALIPNNEVYSAGINVVYIIGLAKLIDMTFSMNSEIILMSNYFRYNVLFTVILAIVAIATNWYFIQIYGMEGAAIATGITLIIFNLIKLIFLRLRLGLWPFTMKNLALLLIAMGTFVSISQLPFIYNTWIDHDQIRDHLYCFYGALCGFQNITRGQPCNLSNHRHFMAQQMISPR